MQPFSEGYGMTRSSKGLATALMLGGLLLQQHISREHAAGLRQRQSHCPYAWRACSAAKHLPEHAAGLLIRQRTKRPENPAATLKKVSVICSLRFHEGLTFLKISHCLWSLLQPLSVESGARPAWPTSGLA